jgi:hypothetical protein
LRLGSVLGEPTDHGFGSMAPAGLDQRRHFRSYARAARFTTDSPPRAHEPQRVKVPDAGDSGQGVCNRAGAERGEADCASPPWFGLTSSLEAEAGGFFGRSAVCGRCSFLPRLSFFFDTLLDSSPKILSGGRVSATSGRPEGFPSCPPSDFSVANHPDIVPFNSSIESHPARPRLANTAIKVVRRAQTRIERLIRRTGQCGPIRTYDGKQSLTQVMGRRPQCLVTHVKIGTPAFFGGIEISRT